MEAFICFIIETVQTNWMVTLQHIFLIMKCLQIESCVVSRFNENWWIAVCTQCNAHRKYCFNSLQCFYFQCQGFSSHPREPCIFWMCKWKMGFTTTGVWHATGTRERPDRAIVPVSLSQVRGSTKGHISIGFKLVQVSIQRCHRRIVTVYQVNYLYIDWKMKKQTNPHT